MKQLLLFSAVLAGLLAGCNPSQPVTSEVSVTQFVRKNASLPEAAADLRAYALGIEAMKELDCADPRSWYYQGAMHHLPDTINGTNALCSFYQNKGDYRLGFATCPHMRPDLAQFHFLTWHRLYIWYYEKLIRHFSGKADFALPYWDYNAPEYRLMPDIFRDSSTSLFEPDRSRYLLTGNPIAASDSDGIVVTINGKVTPVCKQSMAIALDTSTIWGASDIHIFSAGLEDAPHNVIHDYVGGAVDAQDMAQAIPNRIYQQTTTNLQGLMADVPSAGFDPIFFLHHANIDRLWMTWESDFPDKALTWEDFQQAGSWPYVFFLPNGDTVQYTSMQQVFDTIRAIDYTYQNLLKKQMTSTRATPLRAGTVMHSVQPGHVIKSRSHVDLVLPKLLKDTHKAETYYSLEVEVSFPEPHHNHLAVMLVGENPDSAMICQAHLAGVAGFFGAHQHTGHADHSNHDGRFHKTLVFDVTDELGLQKALDDKKIQVQIQQITHGQKAAEIRVERVTLKAH